MTIYRIGEVEFDPDACEIYTEGHLEHLQPKVRDALLCLVRHQGEVLPKQQLVNEAWNGRMTSDESVTRCISILRKHLADRSERHVIETIPKTGYRLHGPVQSHLSGHRASPIRGTGALPGASLQPKILVNLLVTVSALLALLCLLLIVT